jgi:hypothetical protein
MTADNFFHLLALEGFGWKDIHATNVENPDCFLYPSRRTYFLKFLATRGPKFIWEGLLKPIRRGFSH